MAPAEAKIRSSSLTDGSSFRTYLDRALSIWGDREWYKNESARSSFLRSEGHRGLRLLVADELEELLLRFGHAGDRNVIQVPLRTGVDRDDLVGEESGSYCGCLRSSIIRLPRSSCVCVALSSSVPSWANASSSRKAARSRQSEPATFFMAFVWAFPPTRETEIPTLMAGRTPGEEQRRVRGRSGRP